MHSTSFLGGTRTRTFSFALFALNPGRTTVGSTCVPIGTTFCLFNVNAKLNWLSQLGHLRGHLLGAAEKVGALNMWTSCFQGEAGGLLCLLE